jgi:hypothetical protein
MCEKAIQSMLHFCRMLLLATHRFWREFFEDRVGNGLCENRRVFIRVNGVLLSCEYKARDCNGSRCVEPGNRSGTRNLEESLDTLQSAFVFKLSEQGTGGIR